MTGQIIKNNLWEFKGEEDLVGKLKKNQNVQIVGVSSDLAKSFLLKYCLNDLDIEKKTRTIFWIEGNKNEAFKYSTYVKSFFGDRLKLLNLGQLTSFEPDLSKKILLVMWEKYLQSIFKENLLGVFFDEEFDIDISPKIMGFKLEVKRNYPLIILCDELISAGFNQSDLEDLPPLSYKKQGDILTICVTKDVKYILSFIGDEIEAIEVYFYGKRKQINEIEIPLFEKQNSLKYLTEKKEGRFMVYNDFSKDEFFVETTGITFTSFPESDSFEHLRYISMLKYNTKSEFILDIKEKVVSGWKIIFLSKHTKEIKNYLDEDNIQNFTDPDFDIFKENVPRGCLLIELKENDFPIVPQSFQNPKDKIAILTDKEIFQSKKLKSLPKTTGERYLMEFLMSLKPGSFVVHEQHGIGRFQGTVQKIVDNISREYLEVEFRGGDKIFVPVDQTDKISRYITDDDTEPVLSRLNSQEWSKTIEKAKEEAKKIAKELLNLYAKRQMSKRKPLGPDIKEQQEFEDKFPYTETEGQLQASKEIKEDLEKETPMDRLLCGDVGFGKTEVAMRAAFKVAMAGRQVAVVSPITILAHQHFESFKKRMDGFPLRIEIISRFRSGKDQTEILKRLKNGDIDIIIGTHRLLQKDVEFKDLGIVIVDEEQRFGVEQKEFFKKMRANVDILSLSATPIPRTLHLSLNKIRDISTINTPPPGRLPVVTEVRKYSDTLVRDAILKEIQRGGQVYFLHNRVETIEGTAEKLRKLVPEANFVVGHGKLDPKTLEERILSFKNGEYNVLVSSTIIENGIDLANANTLLVNNADKFGLSQLYQLRGRVGRGKTQAFAYLLYHGQKLTLEAKKRLRAIVEATELGSGFQIAMKDLEIRGAGDLLGLSQHGVMKSVGVGHFIRLLNQTVEELKSGISHEEKEDDNVSIELPFAAYIPDYFVSDSKEKIQLYQKIASLVSFEEIDDFKKEIEESYGNIPLEIGNLLKVIQMKIEAKNSGVLGIRAVQVTKEKKEIRLALSSKVTAPHIVNLLSKNPKWMVSGTLLKIDMMDLGIDWYGELLKSIKLLSEEVKLGK